MPACVSATEAGCPVCDSTAWVPEREQPSHHAQPERLHARTPLPTWTRTAMHVPHDASSPPEAATGQRRGREGMSSAALAARRGVPGSPGSVHPPPPAPHPPAPLGPSLAGTASRGPPAVPAPRGSSDAARCWEATLNPGAYGQCSSSGRIHPARRSGPQQAGPTWRAPGLRPRLPRGAHPASQAPPGPSAHPRPHPHPRPRPAIPLSRPGAGPGTSDYHAPSRDETALLGFDQHGRPLSCNGQQGSGDTSTSGQDAHRQPQQQQRAELRCLNEPQPSYGLGPIAPNRDGVEQDDIKFTILEKTNRKSARVRQLQQIQDTDQAGPDPAGAPPPSHSREDQFRRLQKQLLLDVHSARGRNKSNFIREQLRRAMLVRRVVRPGYGEVVVYEHEFSNPYNDEQVFEVRVSHPSEVSVLSKTEEYRALRAANARFFGNPSQPAGPLEQEVMAGNRLYLHPSEKITLPLKIQSFEPPPGYTNPAQRPGTVPVGTEQNNFSRAAAAEEQARAKQGRDAALGHVVTVELFSVRNQHVVAVVELQLVPRPLVIDRTFRFFGGEKDLLRQTIRMRNLPGADVTYAGGRLRHLAVAASHKDVIAGVGSTGLTGGAERDEVYLKYKTGAAPGVEQFYVLVYLDRLLARPVEVWQMFVHALRKVDMRAMIGQTSQASVVVRGAATSRRVHCYSSHPDELQVSPDQFVLVAGSLTEVMLSFRPVAHGRQDIKVHLVDVESRELVYALIVSTEGTGPLISRTFEIELPAGTVANKKITYTNPYQQFRTFMLRSNQPWLMSFTPARLQLPPGATRPLGLTFDARAATTGVVDALVFVNDEEDKTEECFKVRVRIYR